MLFHHPDIAHHHPAIHRFAHVIHSQQADLHRRQRFHFNAGLAESLHLRLAVHTRIGHIRLKIHRHPRQRQRMAQGNQVAGALGRHDRGDARDAEHIPLLGRAAGDDRQRLRLHADGAAGQRDAVGFLLGADVDHVGLPGGVEVGQVVGWRGGCGVGHDEELTK